MTNVTAPFDMRHKDPSYNYGIGGLLVYWVLVGPKGATQFAVSFPAYLPHVMAEGNVSNTEIMGYDVGYHANYPMYDGQTDMDCSYTESGKCFYDGSSLRADQWVEEIFSIRGERPEVRIWDKLEQEYMDRFEGSGS